MAIRLLVSYAFVIGVILLGFSIGAWFWIDRTKVSEKAVGVFGAFASSFLGISFGLFVSGYEERGAERAEQALIGRIVDARMVEFAHIEYGLYPEPLMVLIRGRDKAPRSHVLIASYLDSLELRELNTLDELMGRDAVRAALVKHPTAYFAALSDQAGINAEARRFNALPDASISSSEQIAA